MQLVNYTAVDDVGTVIDPMIVEGQLKSARRSIDAAAGDWPVGACPQCASVVGSEKQIFGANQQVPQRDNFTRRQRQDPLRVSAAGLRLWRRRTAGKTRMRTVVQTIIVALAVACCASACTQEQRAGCVIKGNISSSGERIYHVPGQRYYDKTLTGSAPSKKLSLPAGEKRRSNFRGSSPALSAVAAGPELYMPCASIIAPRPRP